MLWYQSPPLDYLGVYLLQQPDVVPERAVVVGQAAGDLRQAVPRVDAELKPGVHSAPEPGAKQRVQTRQNLAPNREFRRARTWRQTESSDAPEPGAKQRVQTHQNLMSNRDFRQLV